MSTPTLTKADFQSDQETRWCPGCGDYAILAQVQATMPDLGIPPERVVFVTGIGCAGRFSYYMDTYGMHVIHGRAPAVATGLAAARDDLSLWVVSGDGDALSIGGNHLVHALRRNVPIKLLLFNNRIYGLTKGQASPTSELGKITKSSPEGTTEPALDAVLLALASGATFVARTIDRDKQHLGEVLRAAAAHPGAAFVEILQNCPVFNDGVQAPFVGNAAAGGRIPLVHGEPIRFGADDEMAVVPDGQGSLRIAAAGDADPGDVVVHDKRSLGQALALSRIGDPVAGPLPLGIFRDVDQAPWGEGTIPRLREARESLDDDALDGMLQAGDTWTVA